MNRQAAHLARIILRLCLLCPAVSAFAQSRPTCAAPLLERSSSGAVVAGSPEQLMLAARRGQPLKVGWGHDLDQDQAVDLWHWSDARFITLLGTVVTTQVQSIHQQIPDHKAERVSFSPAHAQWHGMLDSEGRMSGRFEHADRVTTRPVHSLWCLATPESLSWRRVYRHDVSGTALEGSLSDLRDAVRAGQAIQIGWGLSRTVEGKPRAIEHRVSPVFLTINDEAHIVAQMPEHIAQSSYWDIDRARFDDGAVLWRGLATTQGRFDAIWVDRATGKVVRRSPQRAAFTWFAQGPAHQAASLAAPEGVMADQ